MSNETQQWQQFITHLQTDILPIYTRHEDKFDYPRIHGRLHICRSIVLAECMATLYSQFLEVDRFAIRYAIAFHDSGRQGNGIDIWEADSAANCYSYLQQKLLIDEPRAEYISKFIVKKDKLVDINNQITHDADVLEIMRLTGKKGFEPFHLQFGRNFPTLTELKETLINEAWQLIDLTEQIKERLSPSTYLQDLITLAQAYPLLASSLQ